MKVLTAVASRHDGTMEFGHAIGDNMTRHGLDVADMAVEDVPPGAVAEYDPVVLGSAV